MLHPQPCFSGASQEHFRSKRTEKAGREAASNVGGKRVGRKSCIHMVYASTSDHAHTHKRRRKFSLAHPRPKTTRLSAQVQPFSRSIHPLPAPPILLFCRSSSHYRSLFRKHHAKSCIVRPVRVGCLPVFGISFGLFKGSLPARGL